MFVCQVTAEEALRSFKLIIKEIAALPQVTTLNIVCLSQKGINLSYCQPFAAVNDAYSKQIIYSNYMFISYLICGITFYFLFSMKYWVLSLKTESLLRREEKLASSATLKAKLLAATTVLFFGLGATLWIANGYKSRNLFDI